MGITVESTEWLLTPLFPGRIEYVPMTSRPPCWRSKQYRVGHIGGVYKSSGN